MGFRKGQSGNPKGRPRGSADKRSALRGLLEPQAPALVAKVVEQALAGDMAALKMCIDRLIPPLSPESPAVKVDADAANVTKAGEVVLQKAFAGDLSPEVAQKLLHGLRTQTQIAEVDELIQRVEALEASAAQR